MELTTNVILQIAVLIIAVIAHEVSHGYAAYLLGDPTAKYAGRLTLNPIKHLDLWGSLLIPLLLIISNAGVIMGWAKPVPYNPYNLKNQKYGPAIVAIAGPLSNLLLALIAGLVMRMLIVTNSDGLLVFQIMNMFVWINILLLIFNLLPIPPLDGSKILYAIIPVSERTKMTLEQYGFVLVLVFIWFFSRPLFLLINFVYEFFLDKIVFIGIT